ncbi:MAG: FAD binding domain-containing protein [Oscillospiraceae bacterium]|nr:FAD binding domain-containing protein [Oscillospiraceae bacterium]
MYQFLSPKTIGEAKEHLAEKSNLKVLAGGTDLIIGLRDGAVHCDYIMDIKHIPELCEIGMTDDGLEVGAGVSLNAMLASGLCTGRYAALADSGHELANSLLRNRATLAGNICHASPGGDMLAPVLVLDAWVETLTPNGGRKIPLKDFFTGVKRHVLAADEMVVKTVFPRGDGTSAYHKKKRIRGHDLAQVGVAGSYAADGTLKLAFGAAGPTPVLIELGVFDPLALRAAREEILDKAMSGISPISDVRASKEHRLAMARYLAGDVLDALLEKVGV